MEREFERHVAYALRDLNLGMALSKTMLSTARDAIVCINATGQVVVFNRAAEEMFGYRAEEILEQNVGVLMPSPYREEHDEYLRQYQETRVGKAIGRVRYVEARRKDGHVFPIELSVSEGSAGSAVLYTAIIRDVTERNAYEEAIRASGRQQAVIADLGQRALAGVSLSVLMDEAVRLVAQTLGVPLCRVLELRPDRRTLRMCAGHGWRAGLVGATTVEMGPDSQAGLTLSSNEPVITEDVATETRFKVPQLFTDHGVVSGMSVVIHGREEAYGILGVHSTERRSFTKDDALFLQAVANVLATSIQRSGAEEEARKFEKLAQQRERLADIGAIAAKIVHDLGNPVAALSMQAQLLLRRAMRDPAQSTSGLKASAERILAEAQRLDHLVNDFKDFARQQRLDVKPIELRPFLDGLVALWQPVAAERQIKLTLELLDDDLSSLRADAGKLRRVLDNLVKNAVEAIDTGPGHIQIRVSAPTAEMLRISIQDSGPGIPEKLRVFKLFETTKSDGSGLGLAIAKEIAHAHGGSLEVERLEPHGTIFHLDLPQHGRSAQ